MLQGGLREPRAWPASVVSSGLAMDETGLVLGTFPLLAHDQGREQPESASDCERLLTLLSVAYRRPVGAHVFTHIDAAVDHWRRGDKALANLRLAYAGLPALDDRDASGRLRLADWLLGEGVTPRALMKSLDLDTVVLERRYNPNQPRVPAGNGRDSGRWAAFWQGLSNWLAEPVPEYDIDTGDVVGTRSRGKAIATNPLTILAVGAGALAGAEALLVAEVGASAVEETGLAANAARGLESEARVLKEMGLVKNTRAVSTAEGSSVPDALTDTLSVEIKDSVYVAETRQIRIQTRAAESDGRTSVLVTGTHTKITKKALDAFDRVVRRDDLGPRLKKCVKLMRDYCDA